MDCRSITMNGPNLLLIWRLGRQRFSSQWVWISQLRPDRTNWLSFETHSERDLETDLERILSLNTKTRSYKSNSRLSESLAVARFAILAKLTIAPSPTHKPLDRASSRAFKATDILSPTVYRVHHRDRLASDACLSVQHHRSRREWT